MNPKDYAKISDNVSHIFDDYDVEYTDLTKAEIKRTQNSNIEDPVIALKRLFHPHSFVVGNLGMFSFEISRNNQMVNGSKYENFVMNRHARYVIEKLRQKIGKKYDMIVVGTEPFESPLTCLLSKFDSNSKDRKEGYCCKIENFDRSPSEIAKYIKEDMKIHPENYLPSDTNFKSLIEQCIDEYLNTKYEL